MIPKEISEEHVLKAIDQIDREGVPENRLSTRFYINFNGRNYPPKYVISLANIYVNGKELDPNLFSGGEESNKFLSKLGFEIIAPSGGNGMDTRQTIIEEEQKHLNTTVQDIDSIVSKIRGDIHYKKKINNLVGLENYNQRIQDYERAAKDPYFGRLDFLQDGKENKIYIGKIPVCDHNQKNLIIDWRTPIGDVYYSYHGGPSEIIFRSEDLSQQKIKINLKRELKIQQQKVQDFNDIISDNSIQQGITTRVDISDKYLINLLSETRVDNKLKEIISSIRKEQNEIIRLDLKQPALIQGVAGSGKSTIALHRISYLLYRYAKELKASDILILAPNKMFLSYIQDVVKELDIEGIQRHTFSSLVKEIIPDIISITEPTEMIRNIVDGKEEVDKALRLSSFKGSIKYRFLINSFLNKVNKEITNFTPLYVDEGILMTKEDLLNKYRGISYLPVTKRNIEFINSLWKWLEEKKKIRLQALDDEFSRIRREWINVLPERDQRKVFYFIEKAYDLKVRQFEVKVNDAWIAFKKQVPTMKSLSLYNQFLSKPLLKELDISLEEGLIDCLVSTKEKPITYDDLPALLYIESKLNELPRGYQYIVVDEAQDLSPFHIFMLKQLTKSMILLGDVTQRIQSGIKQWDDLIPDVFDKEELKRMDLKISYRSTTEIMEIANTIMKNSFMPYPNIIPVQRHGEKVKIERIYSDDDFLNKLHSTIKTISDEGKDIHKIAIIHKDLKISENLFNVLKKEYLSIQLIINQDMEIKERIVVLPTYLAKGLEFDAVIMPNVNMERFRQTEFDARLLFVSVTRALHYLHIFYLNQPSPLLKGCYIEEGRYYTNGKGIL